MQPSQPQHPEMPNLPMMRLYAEDEHYTADAVEMARSGWRVVKLTRLEDDSLLAFYAHTPESPLSMANYRRLRLLGVVGVLIALCMMFSTMFAVFAATGNSGTTIASDAQATSAATATTDAASALAPILVSGAHLGAPFGDFDSAFGPAQSIDTWYTTLSGQSVMIVVQRASTTGGEITTPDGQDRVYTVTLNYLGVPPSAAQNSAICRQFLPPDAQHIADDTTMQPVHHIYRSSELAASFDANAFQNNDFTDVTPGTLDVVYGQRICDVSTGQ